ncbi:SDR family NAD(P)-dependent oxidoreductase, partial [Rhizobiaceae sp. 2RAB30]
STLQKLYPGCKVHFVAADTCVTEQAIEAGRKAEELMGGVDVLVNSTVSAYPYPTLFHKIDISDIQGMVLTQVMSHFLLARVVMDGMREREN